MNKDNVIDAEATPVDSDVNEEKVIKNVIRRIRNKRIKRYVVGAGSAALVISLVVILASKGKTEASTDQVVDQETDNN